VDAFEKLGYRNTLLVAMHGGSRVDVENHWSEAILNDAALVEIGGVSAGRAVRKVAAIRDILSAGDSESPVVLNFKRRVDALEHTIDGL
jgi:hypothetical protein